MPHQTGDYDHLSECLREQLVMWLESRTHGPTLGPKANELLKALNDPLYMGYKGHGLELKVAVPHIYDELENFVELFKRQVEKLQKLSPPVEVD